MKSVGSSLRCNQRREFSEGERSKWQVGHSTRGTGDGALRLYPSVTGVPHTTRPRSAEMGVKSAVLWLDYPFSGFLSINSSIFKELHRI